MKRLLMACLVVGLLMGLAYAGERVEGYFKKDGTYVQPYTRSTPDNSYNNNYNVQGNYNPYTGQQGTDRPTYNDRTPEYNQKTYGNPGYETTTPTYNYNSGSKKKY